MPGSGGFEAKECYEFDSLPYAAWRWNLGSLGGGMVGPQIGPLHVNVATANHIHFVKHWMDYSRLLWILKLACHWVAVPFD